MGWFGKKENDDVEPAGVDSTTGIDFGSYELGALGEDVRSIVDVPGAIGQAAKYALTIPFIVAILTWIVFSSRMVTWVLVLFSLIAFALAFAGALVIGGFFVARKRLDTVSAASGRVVEVVGEMHADVVRVRDGHADTSVQQVAVGLLENAIFPAVFGTVTGTAETALGPLGFLASKVSKAPLQLVQKTVISAIGALPDRQLGQLLDNATTALPAVGEAVSALEGEYHRTRETIEGVVERVTKTALVSVLGLAGISFVPLVLWLLLGWVAS